MKKLIATTALLISTVSFAGPYHHGHGHGHGHGHWRHHGGGWTWVAPVIIGGVVGYEIARTQQPVIVQQTPPPVVIQQENCSPWTEIRNADGTSTITRTCRTLDR